jgi:hypothetical protein
MGNEYVCISAEEYRELVRAKRDAECLRKAMDMSLTFGEIDLMRKLFCEEESGEG